MFTIIFIFSFYFICTNMILIFKFNMEERCLYIYHSMYSITLVPKTRFSKSKKTRYQFKLFPNQFYQFKDF